MKPYLLEILRCPNCEGGLSLEPVEAQFRCQVCARTYPALGEIPVFTQPPENLVPSERKERGPGAGTPWRQANWRFLQAQIDRLPLDATVLDVGAGRGDFASALNGRLSLALDVYPYPEVDLVCDLGQTNPLRPGCFDAILLLNVLEHVYDPHALLSTLAKLIKPGGILIAAVPFLVKIHQAPVDFARYTHFALERLGSDHGLAVDTLEGFYHPASVLAEGLGNLRNSVLPGLPSPRRYPARLLLSGMQALASGLDRLLGSGQSLSPARTLSLSPTGYHVVYRKPNTEGNPQTI